METKKIIEILKEMKMLLSGWLILCVFTIIFLIYNSLLSAIIAFIGTLIMIFGYLKYLKSQKTIPTTKAKQ